MPNLLSQVQGLLQLVRIIDFLTQEPAKCDYIGIHAAKPLRGVQSNDQMAVGESL